MKLLPGSRSLEVAYLTPNGVGKKVTHLDNIVPITLDDHQYMAKGITFFLSDAVDKEMVYNNNLEGENWLFDSQGEWDEEGIAHPELTLEKNWRERDYFRNVTDN